MIARLKAMNEQKVYLNDQLKAIMKRNRVLQVKFYKFWDFSFHFLTLHTFIQAEIEYARQYIEPASGNMDRSATE